MVSTTTRLRELRVLMAQKGLDIYLVPSADAHASEYVDASDHRRAYITGFTGSAGTAMIHRDEALLSTDSRYWLQAQKQMDENWKLFKMIPGKDSIMKYIARTYPGSVLGLDAKLFTSSQVKAAKEILNKADVKIKAADEDLIDLIWEDRPAPVQNPIFCLENQYSGKTAAEKIKIIREKLDSDVHAFVISMMDEVCWLLNIRGSDVQFNPVVRAYIILKQDSCTLYVDSKQVSNQVKTQLEQENVDIKDYSEIFADVELCAQAAITDSQTILCSDHVSWKIGELCGTACKISPSPVALAKAIKNDCEIRGMRNCHVRDGSALVRYFAWLEEQLANKTEISEYHGAEKLAAFRSELALQKGLSFDTISSTGPNGAIIHYKPDPADCAVIRQDQIYLCDSGGQYLDGTTDVTRTHHFGQPEAHEIRMNTRVLQGHIALACAVFPDGTNGTQLDTLARFKLWSEGQDFGHGTGHGVGSFLNVHESPPYIGRGGTHSLQPGMVVSNEPGYYKDGSFGIRIESMMVCVKSDIPADEAGRHYYKFETLTKAPLDLKLVDRALLSPEECAWINTYHEDVRNALEPLLKDDQRALAWLRRECRSI